MVVVWAKGGHSKFLPSFLPSFLIYAPHRLPPMGATVALEQEYHERPKVSLTNVCTYDFFPGHDFFQGIAQFDAYLLDNCKYSTLKSLDLILRHLDPAVTVLKELLPPSQRNCAVLGFALVRRLFQKVSQGSSSFASTSESIWTNFEAIVSAVK